MTLKKVLSTKARSKPMDETITAIYEQGVLRPLTPLELPEHARVEITIRTPDQAAEQRRKVEQALRDAGLLAASPPRTPQTPVLSEEARAALAQRIGAAGGTPLSQIIIEERDGR
jgi:predicted DNA-binding antitoxin AbrB/MazE fold protein